MPHRVHVDLDAPRPITWPHLGQIGTIQRHAIDAAHLRWIARTPAGIQSRPMKTQDDAAFWLRIQADPSLVNAPKPPADPVLEMIARYLRDDELERAESAVLACIAQDIDQMRRMRASTTPPAVWHHLDHFVEWLDALNGATGVQPASATTTPSRLTEILDATRR